MTSSSHEIYKFCFQEQQLASKLHQACVDKPTGYWKIDFKSVPTPSDSPWYIALSQRKVIFSGFDELNWSAFLDVLKCYIPRLRTRKVRDQIQALKQGLTKAQRVSPIIMLNQMVAKGILSYREVSRALEMQVLVDLDRCLFDYSGEAEFFLDAQLLAWPLSIGLNLDNLLTQAEQRRQQWQRIAAFVPSIESIPSLDEKALKQSSLTPQQQQNLQKIVREDKTLRTIAANLGKDTLKLAQTFASLSQKGIISMTSDSEALTRIVPEVFIVDDSPLILQQFTSMVTNLGYKVTCCKDPLAATEMIQTSQPAVVFLDINMPQASGFQLIKLIRSQPELASIPLVILTSEESLSNKMRAKWAKSRFVSKPINHESISQILEEFAPLNSRTVG
jgi:CheY-like chemotaxis protein